MVGQCGKSGQFVSYRLQAHAMVKTDTIYYIRIETN